MSVLWENLVNAVLASDFEFVRSQYENKSGSPMHEIYGGRILRTAVKRLIENEPENFDNTNKVGIFRILTNYFGKKTAEKDTALLSSLGKSKFFDLLKEIIEGDYGFDDIMKSRDFDKRTVLHNILIHNDPKMLKYIVSKCKNLNINVPDGYRMTPLHLALSYGNSENVTYLLELGADICQVDFFGNKAIHFVESLDNLIILIREGADVEAEGENMRRLIHNSICNGNYEIVKFLIDSGVDLLVKDSHGFTPRNYLDAYFVDDEENTDLEHHNNMIKIRDLFNTLTEC